MGNDLTSATWRKSSFSGGNGGDCVEVATLADGIAMRDSKDRTGPVLTFALDEWAAFTAGVREGQFDLS